MKQVVQDFKDGKVKVIDVPVPPAEPGFLVVRNNFSVISAGTEKTTVDTGKKNIIGKARARPDLVRKVMDNVKKEGIFQTLKKVRTKLEDYKLLGYSSSGVVVEVGEGVRNFSIGDRVACGGGEYATHSEYAKVPVNLCARVPDSVPMDEAAFATIGAIALQGIRQAEVSVGERVGVIGLGLIGIITVQLLKAAGCRVYGIDIDKDVVDRGYEFSMDRGSTVSDNDICKRVRSFTDDFGLDSVIITAGTKSSQPVQMASEIIRDRGKIIIVGAVGMELERENFYLKELGLHLSRSYGPGRYDVAYEEKGIDYPIGYVRWTEGRNMEAVLDLVSQKKINIKELITHKYSIDDAKKVYKLILEGNEDFLGVLFEYPGEGIEEKKRIYVKKKEVKKSQDKIKAGVIGAGSFGKTFILPPLSKSGEAELIGIATSKGPNAVNAAKKFGFKYSTSDYNELIDDKDINTIFILTRHDLHAPLILECMKKDKNIYVEKPLALKKEEIEAIKKEAENYRGIIMIGFNRRFSSHTEKLKKFIGKREGGLISIYRINAGTLPENHWLKDPDIGGGRIIGEGCHFIDLLRYLTDSPIESLDAYSTEEKDNKVIQLNFKDRSKGVVVYATDGDKNFPKERIEVFADGKIGIIDDFRLTALSVNGRKKSYKTRSQEKGFKSEIKAFLKSLSEGSSSPIPFDEIIEVSEWTVEADKH